jgi:hypothetical protein
VQSLPTFDICLSTFFLQKQMSSACDASWIFLLDNTLMKIHRKDETMGSVQFSHVPKHEKIGLVVAVHFLDGTNIYNKMDSITWHRHFFFCTTT